MRAIQAACLVTCSLIAAAPAAFGAKSAPEFAEAKKLYRAAKYDDAMAKLRTAIEKKPKDAKAHYLLGLVYLKLSRWSEAYKVLGDAERLDPAIGFTSKEKFREKLARAKRRAIPSARAEVAPPSAAAPALAPPAPVVAVSQRPAAAEKEGPPLWALILLGVCGALLAVSVVRSRLYPVR